MKLHLIAGARPNFMKIAPLWRGLANHSTIQPSFVHTAQHRDDVMSSEIWRELGLPDPHHVLDWKLTKISDPIAKMMGAYEALCCADKPDMFLVVGDVNSSLAAATIASEMRIPLVHLEAGLRCFDPDMPEEQNRIAIDHMADLLLTPTEDASDNLIAEGIAPNRIRLVGNIMIDTLVMMREAISLKRTSNRLGLNKGDYVLVTLHRQSNVDDATMLGQICDVLIAIAAEHPVCFPLHPRTERRLAQDGFLEALQEGGVRILPALGYLEFTSLMSDAGAVITDSGGVQEETSYLGIRCLTLRRSTERPITVHLGTNRLADVQGLVALTRSALQKQPSAASIPLWDGKAAERVIHEIEQFAANL